MPVEGPFGQWLGVHFQVATAQRLCPFAAVDILQPNHRVTATAFDLGDPPLLALTFDVQQSTLAQSLRPVGEDLHPHRAGKSLGADHAGGGQPLTRR